MSDVPKKSHNCEVCGPKKTKESYGYDIITQFNKKKEEKARKEEEEAQKVRKQEELLDCVKASEETISFFRRRSHFSKIKRKDEFVLNVAVHCMGMNGDSLNKRESGIQSMHVALIRAIPYESRHSHYMYRKFVKDRKESLLWFIICEAMTKGDYEKYKEEYGHLYDYETRNWNVRTDCPMHLEIRNKSFDLEFIATELIKREKIHRERVSSEIQLKSISDSFGSDWYDYLDWYFVSSRLDLTISFITQFQDRLHWDYVSVITDFKILEHFENKIEWDYLSLRFKELSKTEFWDKWKQNFNYDLIHPDSFINFWYFTVIS